MTPENIFLVILLIITLILISSFLFSRTTGWDDDTETNTVRPGNGEDHYRYTNEEARR